MSIRCEIVSQDRMVYEGDVDIVVLPGAAGEMGILPHHAPLLTTLKYGFIKVRQQGSEQVFTVAGGVAEIQPDIVTVLADAAENIEEIDEARAEQARQRAQEILAKGVPADTDAYLAIEAALRRSNLRLEAVRRYRKPSRPNFPGEN
ncbi:MAG: ATP synthase F1 subunit epsilon [Anaerolineae bacterium CG03_land_8_20_14_0_80_58_20]|nr:MAG: ATP synthase F1 subunit epsilon [Anaerolineae bacterium CG1_02_58_13]PIV28209.1 MAG: ATP synthase F1 subunit epsilon [Anaerolineae bacterium CG03_land_8_20_14_0_80_58_20]